MGIEKLNNNKPPKKINRFFLLKCVLIIFSLFLLSFVLYQLIKAYDVFFGPNEEITIGIILTSILIAVVLVLSIFEVLTVKEYRGYFIRRPFIKKGKSYLNLTDIFENENRLNILKQILNNPGIHHNELLRNCDLQKGQLQWHLDVLLRHHIIKKEKYGQYTIYLPINSSFESTNNLKNLLVKSKTTSEILKIIQGNPGINSSEISRVLNLSRNTIKYHIDKLSGENLISLTKKGRKVELYPN